jgi:hypothetical protein
MISSSVRAFLVTVALISALARTGFSQETAQPNQPGIAPHPPAAEMPPVAVGPDWSYEKRGQDVHMFLCRHARCAPPSRVSYRLYAPNSTMTLEQFRRDQEHVVKALQERAPEGTRIEILEITGDEGSGPSKMFTSRRRVTLRDGNKEFVSSSMLLGTRYSASLISSSLSEEASRGNHAIFVMGVMLFINASPQPKP